MQKVKANVFRGINRIGIEEMPRPSASPGDAVIRDDFKLVVKHVADIELAETLIAARPWALAKSS